MAETKDQIAAERDDIAAERDKLAAENAVLKAQLAAAGRTTTPGAQHVFQLSEGDRQVLEQFGVINIGGRLMTKADVVKAMADAGQKGVEIKDAPEATRLKIDKDAAGVGPGVRGVDYVYPSVERGRIDPAVAGAPGINGPAADTEQV